MDGRRLSLQLVICVVSVACRHGGGPSASHMDLLALPADPEMRSDDVDLPLVLSQERLMGEGWVVEGSDAGSELWARRQQVSLTLPFASAADKVLSLRARCYAALGPRLAAAVSLNGHPIGVLELTPSDSEFHLRLAPELQVAGDNLLRFEVPRVFQLPKAGGKKRPRAFVLSSLVTRRPGPAARQAGPERRDGRLLLPPGSSVAYYVRREQALEADLSLRSAEVGEARLVAAAEGRSVSRTLLDVRLGARQSRRFVLPLDSQDAFTRLKLTNLGGGDAWVEELTLRGGRPPGLHRATPARRPNIVMFLVDTLRADQLGAYGQPAPTSPRFDGFAKESILFEDAWAQSSWTRPAVASIFTGLTPEAHGVRGLRDSLTPKLETLAEALQAAGYRTAAYVANHVVSRRFGYDQGFEAWNDNDDSLYGQPASEMVARALRWTASARQPFFLYLHTLDPHGPYTPAPEHWKLFPVEGYDGVRDPTVLAQHLELSALQLRYLLSAYQGEVHQNDAAFGALLDGLRALGRLEDTLVVFVADHGEEFRDHGGGGHGHTLYQETIHVPLAVRLPGGARGGVRDTAPIEQIDLYPTLLTLAGRDAPEWVQGRDHSRRWLEGARSADAPLLYSELQFGEHNMAAIRSGTLKLIVHYDSDRPRGAAEELYDLAGDPRESRNVAAADPFACGYLHAQAATLRALQRRLQERFEAGREITLRPEEEEQLRALGYLQ